MKPVMPSTSEKKERVEDSSFGEIDESGQQDAFSVVCGGEIKTGNSMQGK